MSVRNSLLICLIVCLLTTNIFARYQPIPLEQAPTYPMTIMIDPAGNAQHTGRKIDDCFERGITLQCAQHLQRKLEKQYPGLRIVLTRSAGEVIQPLQSANFANRLNVDLYLSIHFYQEKKSKPKLYIYHFSYGNDFISRTIDLSFYPYEQAYIFNKDKTAAWAHQIQQTLTNESFTALCDIKGPYALPFKPLIGIKSPAIAIEIGLKKATDWQNYIEPIMESLEPIIERYLQKVPAS